MKHKAINRTPVIEIIKDMTQQEKKLLLKDICAKLPYGFIIHRYSDNVDIEINTVDDFAHFLEYSEGEDFKPYLRPMSSMIEEERKELLIILNYEFYVDDDFALVAEDDRHRICLELCKGYIDWLNSHHFDYRGLIKKGLALEAKEGMYKTEHI